MTHELRSAPGEVVVATAAVTVADTTVGAVITADIIITAALTEGGYYGGFDCWPFFGGGLYGYGGGYGYPYPG